MANKGSADEAPLQFIPHEVGRTLPRVDGRAKVTGSATYTAEFRPDGLVHGVAIGSTIPHGRVVSVDASDAEKSPGVIAVIAAGIMPKLKPLPDKVQGIQYSGEGGLIEMLLPMQDDWIHYAGQVVALVVAETFEQAVYAATLVRVRYAEQAPELDLDSATRRSRPDTYCGMEPLQLSVGDADNAYEAAEVRLELHYETPPHYHCAIEMLSTVAAWEKRTGGEVLKLWDTTRVIKTAVEVFAHCLDMPADHIKLVVKYLGGSYGSKAWMFGNTLLVAACSRLIGRPLKVEWTRAQMYEVNGYRPATRQTIRIGAARDGRMTSLRHDAVSPTSTVSGYPEPVTGMTMVMYGVPNLAISQEIRHLNLPTPMPMRGVGVLAGGWALETAVDELAHELGIDPVALRAMHDTDKGPMSGLPFSSRHFVTCLERGKRLIGWDQRTRPGEMRRGRELIGLGVAGSTLPAVLDKASARATLFADGSAEVTSATHEIGNGAYTVFRQIAADALALRFDCVRFDLGESRFPDSPITAGSRTTASVGAAVLDAGKRALAALKALAVATASSPFHGKSADEIDAVGGRLTLRSDSAVGEAYGAVLRAAGRENLSADGKLDPGKEKKFELHSFGALFVEVRVDIDTGVIRVPRVAGVFDVGRMINPRTSQSQLEGGILAGLGAALIEEGYFHPTNGRPVLRNLADYHVLSCADVPDITIDVLDIPDPAMGALGARGLGEIGTNNMPAAIGNAVFNATGRRIRSLPLTPDRVLEALA